MKIKYLQPIGEKGIEIHTPFDVPAPGDVILEKHGISEDT
jgi:hypothetical protein